MLATFHVGTIDDAPCWSFSFGGVNFPRHTESVKATDATHARTRRFRRVGAYVTLDERQVEAVKAGIGKMVVRRAGARGIRLDTTGPFYRADPAHDVPASEFVFMEEVPEAAIDAAMATPATVAVVGSTAARERELRSDPADQKIRKRARQARGRGDAVERDSML